MKTKRMIALTAALAVALSGLALAHGAGEHVKGMVTAVTASSITVQTLEKETKAVSFDSETKFIKSGKPAKASDLKVGDRVVVDVHQMGDMLHAAIVRFGAPNRAATPHSH
ncbi:MAG TPA: DUF5666 domain-containing protein [Terriglobales bacterium]|nr:DUF5666 domain-containing protein [Terriglobales bacterium]